MFFYLLLNLEKKILCFFRSRRLRPKAHILDVRPKAHILDDPLSYPYAVLNVLLGPSYGPTKVPYGPFLLLKNKPSYS